MNLSWRRRRPCDTVAQEVAEQHVRSNEVLDRVEHVLGRATDIIEDYKLGEIEIERGREARRGGAR